MKNKRIIWWTFPLILIIGIYFLGPEPEKPEFNPTLPEVPSTREEIEKHVAMLDSGHRIKPGNEGEIVWADSSRSKTEFVVLYLHGFSASKMEGDPVHRQFAKRFGCNLYLPRFADHGVDTTETLLLFTVDRLWESAKDALAVASKLGDKIIIIGTSTGSTLGLKFAADYPDKVHALINLSPNIALNNPAAFLLNDPWGVYVARTVVGGDYYITEATPEHARYWNKKYRLEALTQLQELLERTMTNETFHKITQPSLTLYYYKSETEQDPQVKVSGMLEMHKELATPETLKEEHAMPKTGFHVIGSSQTSRDVPAVYHEIEKFAINKLKMKPVD
jgi:pimeloyl-ACP methyl ester carboxylesterase